jgi:nitroreductase
MTNGAFTEILLGILALLLVVAAVIDVRTFTISNRLNLGVKDFMMLDAGLAMEHLILAATEQGLGTCWEGWFHEDMARKALNIPEDVRVVAFTPLGYASEERRPRPRKSRDEIVFDEKWGDA